ncbi:MAG TPA: PD-(D/E)XK nuclease family protein [Polyangiaceae bacterium]|nr:PD-(D/E)XK nuclease family protein [Polyangiaceae bacterium]
MPRWAARIKSLGDVQAFYARSFSVDELGTAAVLLEWRDNLVEAGWNGREIAGGGQRLEALAAIEAHDPTQTSLGRADRLVRIARALERAPVRIYDSLELLEDPTLWPRRWQSIFARLADLGTSISRHTWSLPGALADSDLGLLQARLRGERREGTVRGDGTLLFLQGDTPDDLAELTATLLANGHTPARRAVEAKASDVVVRCLDAASLDAALVRHGLPAQGATSESAWRPAMQVLPLAIELAFAPRDPNRVLELLTLPLGPLRGSVGARLARAVTRQPGIGGKEWTRQKAEAARRLYERHIRLALEEGASEEVASERARAIVEDRMKVVEVWLEGPVAAETGATRAELLAPAARVLAWLQTRIREGDVETYGAAYAQCSAFIEALGHDTRETFSQDDARQLVDHFARSEQPLGLSEEAAGRLAHVNHPAALLAPCDRIWMWCFVSAVERQPTRFRWDDDECQALCAAGVTFPDPTAVLRSESASWRRALLAARERMVLIVPRAIKGTATAPHPMWDEVRARLALEKRGAAFLIRDARRLLDGPRPNDVVRLVTCSHLHLPEARGEWRVPADALRNTGEEGTMSVTSLERIATCPLAWVLEHRANLGAGTMSSVATGPILNGNLGHRLIEELHTAGAFELSESGFLARAADCLEHLLRTEGATLLVPGASVERLQVTRQLLRAARDLYRYLEQRGYRIAAVEEVVTTTSAVGPLHGRLDLRLVGADGHSAILDLKWGVSTPRSLLSQGRAVQLAVYARAVAERDGLSSLPRAGYFALSSGEMLSTDPVMDPARGGTGPSLETSLRCVEATARNVIAYHEGGRVLVTGTRQALPLLDALGIVKEHHGQHFQAPPGAGCRYCDYGALCGRKWEAIA